jgi:post-segregation antitoxin (ccd killing protein)
MARDSKKDVTIEERQEFTVTFPPSQVYVYNEMLEAAGKAGLNTSSFARIGIKMAIQAQKNGTLTII